MSQERRIFSLAHIKPVSGDDNPVDINSLVEMGLREDLYTKRLWNQVNALSAGAPTSGSLPERYFLGVPQKLRRVRGKEPHIYKAKSGRGEYPDNTSIYQRMTYSDTPKHRDGSWSGIITTEITSTNKEDAVFDNYSPRIELRLHKGKPTKLYFDWHNSPFDIPGIESFPQLSHLLKHIEATDGRFGYGTYFSIELDIKKLLEGKEGAIAFSTNEFYSRFEQISLRQDPINVELDLRGHRREWRKLPYDKTRNAYVLQAVEDFWESSPFEEKSLGRDTLLQVATEILGLIPFTPYRDFPEVSGVDLKTLLPEESSVDITKALGNVKGALETIAQQMDCKVYVDSEYGYLTIYDSFENVVFYSSITEDLVALTHGVKAPEYPLNLQNQGWEEDIVRVWEQALAKEGIRIFAYSSRRHIREDIRLFWEKLGYKSQNNFTMVKDITE